MLPTDTDSAMSGVAVKYLRPIFFFFFASDMYVLTMTSLNDTVMCGSSREQVEEKPLRSG